MTPRAITIAILAMGGEGGGVLADWIVDLAERSSHYVQTTSVPGVAQRTGSTIYYIELFPESAVKGQDPVLALMPVPGELDIVLASELMEAGRAIQRGFVTRDRTTLIASTHRVYSMTERTAVGDGRVDADALLDAGRAAAMRFVPGDFAKIARDSSSVVSASLFGALAATAVLPFSREQFEESIRRGGVGVEASLRAFAGGWNTALSSESRASTPPLLENQSPGALTARVLREFPLPSHEIVLAGIQRLADYQDEAYAAEYLDLLSPIREANAQFGKGAFTLVRETARYLALWMSYEDAIRVADLKIRATRFDRVRQDVRAAPQQIIQIHEFLHPRVAEIADILPASLGRWLLDSTWPRSLLERFTGKGRIVETTSLTGFLQLYVLANLRPFRRRSLRYGTERQRIHDWLSLLPAIAAGNYNLACELAECPRLIKGYGDTHLRGTRNFYAVIATLPKLRTMPDAAALLKRLREAALADETGEKLSDVSRELLG